MHSINASPRLISHINPAYNSCTLSHVGIILDIGIPWLCNSILSPQLKVTFE